MSGGRPPSIAGFRVQVEGAGADLRRLLDRLWGVRAARFRGRLSYTVRRIAGEVKLLSTEGEIGGWETASAAVLHQGILEDAFSRLGEAFAVHGACVARAGRGVLISGPSGFGKTTLAIRLALRGFRFLADDLVLIDSKLGTVEGVRRGVHLRAGSRALLDAAERQRARAAARHLGRGEWTVDPDRWFGPATRCRRVGLVVLLRAPEDLHRVRRLHAFDLAFLRGRRRLPAPLAALPDLRVTRRSRDGRHWRLEARDPAPIREWVESRPGELQAWAKAASHSPSFDGEPRVVPIGRFQAAIELSQEVVNRGPGTRLAAAYAGREAEIAVDLAATLSEARCYALVPGRLDATVRLVERLFGERSISPRPPGRAAPR